MKLIHAFKYSQFWFGIAALALLTIVACSKESGSTSGEEEKTVSLNDLRMEMADHWLNHFILPSMTTIEEEAKKLNDLSNDFVADPTLEGLTALQDQLKTTWLGWQSAELYLLGPNETQGLRKLLNTYPVNQEKIEANIASASYTFGSLSNIGAEGFPAIDYLIHNDDAEVGFEALLKRSNAEGRRDYLQALSSNIYTAIQKTNEDWRTGDFASRFTAATSAGTDVGSALGLMINALDLHYQRFLRDGKVAIPAGVRSAGVARPLSVEAYYAGYSKDLLIAALQAYLDLYQGNGFNGQSGASIRKYLEEINQADLAMTVEHILEDALRQAGSVDRDLSDVVVENKDAATALFLKLQAFVPALKSDMASVMGIAITNQDNDGD